MSEYKDLRNNTYKINQSVLLDDSQTEQRREEIIEELYRIFNKE
uniref:Uncharacterized protein n=1 Tax=uncultured Bacillota bacterium TaxID=344338 RepID=A0A650EPB4_9FIRM|nr:hypothetical protein Firmicute1046_1440 [uncultured Firmicutes bacterium]